MIRLKCHKTPSRHVVANLISICLFSSAVVDEPGKSNGMAWCATWRDGQDIKADDDDGATPHFMPRKWL